MPQGAKPCRKQVQGEGRWSRGRPAPRGAPAGSESEDTRRAKGRWEARERPRRQQAARSHWLQPPQLPTQPRGRRPQHGGGAAVVQAGGGRPRRCPRARMWPCPCGAARAVATPQALLLAQFSPVPGTPPGAMHQDHATGRRSGSLRRPRTQRTARAGPKRRRRRQTARAVSPRGADDGSSAFCPWQAAAHPAQTGRKAARPGSSAARGCWACSRPRERLPANRKQQQRAAAGRKTTANALLPLPGAPRDSDTP